VDSGIDKRAGMEAAQWQLRVELRFASSLPILIDIDTVTLMGNVIES